MDFTVANVCGLLIRSKLMTPAEMQAMRQRWVAESKDTAEQLPLFLRWLVKNEFATEYQAALLSRGHADDFFLGQYKILERVGRGRMAGVYKAVHPSGQIVAIKVLPPSRAKNSQLLARFEREARLAVKLKHPNVVRSFQLGETKGVHFLVMEYLEGEPLDEVLQRRKRLPPGEAVRLVYQALIGLQHIHEQGMVHRDLKPANLMVVPAPARGDNETTLKSNVKILDIGLAREFFDENSPVPTAERMELTGEGVLLGTPDYLAPEQARDPRAIDIRADIYSLGCVLYHFLTGQPPFPDKNILNQMIRHASENPKPLAAFNPSLPEGLQQIVEWMMAKQPAQRYPTPGRAAKALQAFMMVASDAAAVPEDTPQLRRFLTCLEMEDKDAAATDKTPAPGKPPSNTNIPVAAPVPSSPAVPIATAKPVPKGKPAESPPRRKRRTGVQMATMTPGALTTAAAIPIATAAPVAAVAPPAPGNEQLDVELTEMDPTPPVSSRRLSKRDVLLLAIGAGVGLAVFGLGMLVLAWFRSPS